MMHAFWGTKQAAKKDTTFGCESRESTSTCREGRIHPSAVGGQYKRTERFCCFAVGAPHSFCRFSMPPHCAGPLRRMPAALHAAAGGLVYYI